MRWFIFILFIFVVVYLFVGKCISIYNNQFRLANIRAICYSNLQEEREGKQIKKKKEKKKREKKTSSKSINVVATKYKLLNQLNHVWVANGCDKKWWRTKETDQQWLVNNWYHWFVSFHRNVSERSLFCILSFV